MAGVRAKPTCKQLMSRLRKLGKESHRKTFVRHGAPADQIFGVPVADLKVIQKEVKQNHDLALELFETGNADAQYLAGLITAADQMKRSELNRWARLAAWPMVATYSVAGVAADSPHAVALGTKWIDAKQEKIAMIGWPTLGGYLSVTPDEEIDLKLFRGLLDRVAREIHQERNCVKDAMNTFLMTAGCSVGPLKNKALQIARKVGKVDVDVGDTACKIHCAEDYIKKVEGMGRIGKKRKSARC